MGGFGFGAGRPARGPQGRVRPADFDAFERLLGDVQTAYGREDLGALRAPDDAGDAVLFAEELTETRAAASSTSVSDVKLLQGDLAEAWREGDSEYATVAMR